MIKNETYILQQAYNAGVNEEFERLTTSEGKIEFEKVCRAIEKYTPPEAVVYDIGCGPGRYAEFLINGGCSVGCVDLSEKALERINETSAHCSRGTLLFKKSCCASELSWLPSESADVVLLLGPMYHLTRKEKRKAVVDHCHRIVKRGGYVLSMFMSPYALLHPLSEEKTIKVHERKTHIVSTTSFQGFNVPQYRCWPDDAVKEFQRQFLEVEIIHIDKADIPVWQKKCFSSNLPENKEQISHQYFVVYKKL